MEIPVDPSSENPSNHRINTSVKKGLFQRSLTTKTGVDRHESKFLNSSARGWTYGHSIVDGSGNDTFSGVMGSVGPVSSAQMTFMMNGGEMTNDH
jgi:hypothetical protein